MGNFRIFILQMHEELSEQHKNLIDWNINKKLGDSIEDDLFDQRIKSKCSKIELIPIS
jgi:hypothetical protein